MDPQSDLSMDKNDCLDYLVIDSGYTALLISNFGFNNCELIMTDLSVPRNGEYRLSHTNKSNLYDIRCRNELNHVEDQDLIEFMETCLLIYDGVWGNGLYRIGNNDDIDKLLHIINTKEISTLGIICFKCKNRLDIMKRIGILQQFGFARLHKHVDTEYIEMDGTLVAVAKYRN